MTSHSSIDETKMISKEWGITFSILIVIICGLVWVGLGVFQLTSNIDKRLTRIEFLLDNSWDVHMQGVWCQEFRVDNPQSGLALPNPYSIQRDMKE